MYKGYEFSDPTRGRITTNYLCKLPKSPVQVILFYEKCIKYFSRAFSLVYDFSSQLSAIMFCFDVAVGLLCSSALKICDKYQ